MAVDLRQTFLERVAYDEGGGVVIPADTTEEEALRLSYPFVPPPPGTPDAEAWTRLDLQPPVRDVDNGL